MDEFLPEVEFTDEADSDEEIGAVKPDQVSEAVVFSADWTVGTILSQLQQGNIDLSPRSG